MDGAIRPVEERERVEALDVLRGLAVLGILLVNMGSFAHPFTVRTGGPPDPVVTGLIRFFAEGKFYSLFSLLFGVGLAVYMEKAERAGRKVAALFARRLGVLAAIGVVHGTLIWAGDILFTYAILGFLLLAMHKVRPWVLLLVSGLLLVVPVVLCGGGAALVLTLVRMAGEGASLDKYTDQIRESVTQAYAAYRGSFGQIAVQRVKDWLSLLIQSAGALPAIFGMFLLGLWIGRKGIHRDLAAHKPLLRRWLWIGLGLGLPLAAAYTANPPNPLELPDGPQVLAALAGTTLGGAALAVAYACGIALLLQRAWPRRVLGALAPVGRMALTNYLMHSVVFTTLFYGYGFGLYGEIGPRTGLWLTLGMFVFQLVFSRLWLAWYRFGPVEWLWRSLTYGERQPMRRPKEGQAELRSAS